MHTKVKGLRSPRKREETSQTSRYIKIDNDLLRELEKQEDNNRFINEAIKEKLAKETSTPAHS